MASAVARFLTSEPFSQASRASVVVTHLARHEPRLRQVVSVRQVLLNTSSLITEGPGELRLGVKGLDKLYEYWVFLKILEQLRNDLGEPLGRGFEQLAVRLPGGRLRLELPAGTTIEFPHGVRAAFSPTITQSGRNSWQGLELAGMPPSTGVTTPSSVEPDIVVQGGPPDNRVIVIDAKYRARHLIDDALWDVHRKYGRFRHQGIGTVSEVVVAHPHETLMLRWAGQRAVPFVPGGPIASDLWPLWRTDDSVSPSVNEGVAVNEPTESLAVHDVEPRIETPDSDVPATETARMPDPGGDGRGAANAPARRPMFAPKMPPPSARPAVPVQDVELVICDQQWTSTVLFGGRLDLLYLRQMASVGQPSYMIGSNQGSLGRFHEAAYHRGWNIVVANDRSAFIAKVDDLLGRLRPKVVAVISGNADVIELARSHGCLVDVVDDLEEVMGR